MLQNFNNCYKERNNFCAAKGLWRRRKFPFIQLLSFSSLRQLFSIFKFCHLSPISIKFSISGATSSFIRRRSFVSKLQEFPASRYFALDVFHVTFLQGPGIVVFLGRNRVSDKNYKGSKNKIFTEKNDSNQDFPMKNFIPWLFFLKSNQSRHLRCCKFFDS